MPNPFNKYLGKEDQMQNQVMNYLKYNYPKALFTHISNEGKDPFERYKNEISGI